MSTNDVLALRYRPDTWKLVVGQKAVVKSFKSVIEKRSNRTFLLSGPSGTGKTTLSRIAAKEAGCTPANIMEIDAASFSGVDDMREVTKNLVYRPMDGSPRAIILDEVHRVSAAGFASLLKPLEEAPEWVWWFLCTTDVGKVPQAVQTRCTRYNLSAVGRNDLLDLLEDVAKAEKMEIGKDDDEQTQIIDLCAREARGSPRAALVNLGAVATAESLEAARQILRAVSDTGSAYELAKELCGAGRWDVVKEILTTLGEESPESVRHVVRAYSTSVIMNGKTKDPARYFAILDEFSKPFVHTDGISPLVLACGRLLLGKAD